MAMVSFNGKKFFNNKILSSIQFWGEKDENVKIYVGGCVEYFNFENTRILDSKDRTKFVKEVKKVFEDGYVDYLILEDIVFSFGI